MHENWMRYALALAEKGRFTTSPNPMVGACVVKKGHLIASGYHQVYGGDHAEVIALKKAGRRAQEATLYVTLEPCATWGKTPPCTGAILKSGVSEVVIGSFDPNPKNQKKGIAALKKAGIRVISGVLKEEVQEQNNFFFTFIKERRPFVTLKMAQSLDGKIATWSGHSRWISSKPAREFVHQLRAEQDAILVGKNTLFQDNPRLSPLSSLPRLGKPWRIALDPQGKISRKARLFEGDQLTFTVVSEKHAKKGSAIMLPVSEINGRLNLQELLRKLGSLGVAKLLVEGGGELAWSLIEQKLVDKFYWIVAPKFIGGSNAKTSVEGKGVRFASDAFNCKITTVAPLGDDLLIEGTL